MPQAGLTGSQQVQNSTQYAALGDFLAGRKDLGGALDAFSEPVENEYISSASTEGVGEQLTIAWRAIISQAAQTSFTDPQQQKLVDFVLGLQKRPTLQKDGQACQVQEMTVWGDLPTFGWSLRDAWNLAADDNSDQASKDQWINLNAFVAALLGQTFQQSGDALGLSLFCIWTVRQGLEESQSTPDVAVAAAAAWFVFAAPTIAKLSLQGKAFDGKVAKPGSAFQDADWNGFSQERWQAWEQQLGEAQVSDNTAKQLLEQAREAVAEVEQS